MTEVRTRDEAIALVDRALHAWSTSLSGVLEQARAAVRAACEEADRTVRQRANEVAAIEAVLSSAEPKKQRALESELARTRESSDRARLAQTRIENVASAVGQLLRAHVTITTTQVAGARAQLSAMSRALDGYRSTGLSYGGGSSGSPAPSGGVPTATDRTPLTDLDVSTATFDDNPLLDDDWAHGRFGKGGLTRADYRWAVQTWNDTVGPGVAGGKTRDAFADRDARTNARPLRRTADVYDLFLGSERIRADRRPDGSLNITNGRHRLVIAQELGIKYLPGEVR